MAHCHHVPAGVLPRAPGGRLGVPARQEDEGLGHQRGETAASVVTCVDTRVLQAYLVLKEREDAGVEPISKDFVDSAKILAHLPSDEELKEAGVVINV